MHFLYTPLSFLSLWLLSPAAVLGFRFPFLVVMGFLRVCQRLFSLLSLCCSLLVLFASVSSSFSPVRLLRLEFRTPYSLVGCSDFSSTSVGVLSSLLASPFLSFVFLPCLPFFRSFRFRSPAIFPIYPSFCFAGLCVFTCGSPFSSPLSARLLLLRALLPSLWFVCLSQIFSLEFLSFTSFCLRFFPLQVAIVFSG